MDHQAWQRRAGGSRAPILSLEAFLPSFIQAIDASRSNTPLSISSGVPGMRGDCVDPITYTTFLYSDIHLALHPSLPPAIAQQTTHLPGPYILQIVDITDIGHSKLSLLKMVTDAPHQPIPVAVKRPFLSEERSLPRGLIRMEVTDGSTVLSMMETTKPVNGLSILTPLGTKIWVKNIQVHRGMMVIGEQTIIRILGGRVASLCQLDPIERLRRAVYDT